MANEITSANVAQAITKLIAAEALPALESNLVMGNLVNRNYDSVLAQSGDTVNVPIPPPMTASNLAEGGSVARQNPSLGNAQVTLSTHAEATFFVPDVTRAIAQPDLIALYMQPAIIALAEKIEGDLFGLYPQLTANTPVGTGGSAITEAVVDAAETALFNAKVPQGEPRYLVVNGDTYSTLRQIGRFTEMLTYGTGVPIATGQVLQVKGFNVFRSQLVKKPASTTYNLAFVRNAMTLVIRRLDTPLPGTGAVAEYTERGSFGLRVTMSYQPNQLGQQFTVDVLYGCGVLRANHGVQVLS